MAYGDELRNVMRRKVRVWKAHLCDGCTVQNGRTDQDAVWRLRHVNSRNHGGQERTNPFSAARGNKPAMRPFASFWAHANIAYRIVSNLLRLSLIYIKGVRLGIVVI